MALINCPECKKGISNSTSKCIHCGFVLKRNIPNINNVSFKLPLILSIIYFVCVLAYIQSFISSDLLATCYLILGMIFVFLFSISSRKLSKVIIDKSFTVIFCVGTFLFAFDYNISRVFSGLADWGFFDFYNDSLGIFLAVYQIIAIMMIIVLILSMYSNFINEKAKTIIVFSTGIVGFGCFIYQIIYLKNIWGSSSGSNSFYLWFAVCTLVYYLVYVALQIEKLKAFTLLKG